MFASLFTCGIAVPHMIASGDERLIETYVRPTLRGEKIGSLAITEPGGGSDVGHLTHEGQSATATTTSSTAPRPTSPPACGPTTS